MESEYPWLGGFFDGEGSIGIYPTNKDRTGTRQYYVMKVSLAQSGHFGFALFNKLRSQYGGFIQKVEKDGCKVMYKWQLAANQASKFLQDLSPYLQLKSKEAMLALLFQKLENKSSENPEAIKYAEEVKELKQNY